MGVSQMTRIKCPRDVFLFLLISSHNLQPSFPSTKLPILPILANLNQHNLFFFSPFPTYSLRILVRNWKRKRNDSTRTNWDE